MRIGLPVIFLLIASAILAVVHWSALMLDLYWQYLWLDVPMHALGGAVVALIPFALVTLRVSLPERLLRPVPVLVLVLVFGLIWEVFEHATGATFAAKNYVFDTSLDLFLDLIGGYVGYIVGSRTQNF
ncbi:hypothetical protein KTR10_00365 [Candidatus Kaiserbacteria bacterium]|nr:hypothetical protein [Candidatus Kaiserbacteria bacterium]